MKSSQLRLVTEPPPAHDATTRDPVRMIFEHWVFMFGRHPRRTKMDAERRQAISAALALYEGDVQEIMRAVEGMAAVPLGDKPQSMQDAMREPTWFLATAARIERCLRYSDQLIEMAETTQRQAACPQEPQAPADPAAAAAARERLRALAVSLRSVRD